MVLEIRARSGRLGSPERVAQVIPWLARLEPEIASTDAEIDNLVYELYGITEEERRIIEGA